jgi:NitT/TauT family transport system permease protein
MDRWRYAAPAIVAVAVLALWQALTVLYDVPQYLVPSPVVVARTLVDDAGLLLASLGVTVSIALAALAIAVTLGVAIALLFVQSRWIETAFTPYVVLLQVTPIVAIAPLIIIWVRDTRLALVLCAVVVAIFPIVSDTTLGLRIASGLALIGAVVAEFVAGTGGQGAGLAYQILMSGIQLNIPRLFAALVLITLAGIAFYGTTVLVSRLALRHWHESEITR